MGTEVVSVPPFYPRPSPRIRPVLEKSGATFLTTGDEGAVRVVSDGRRFLWRSLTRRSPWLPPAARSSEAARDSSVKQGSTTAEGSKATQSPTAARH